MLLSGEEIKKATAALERQKKQYKRQNEYNKNNYYRVSVVLPKSYREIIAGAGVGSVNNYINTLVKDDLARRGLLPSDDPGGASDQDSAEDVPEWFY